MKAEREELQQLEASVDRAVSELEEELQAQLRATPEHLTLTSLEQRLVGEAAALRSHLEAITSEEERLEQFAAHVQVGFASRVASRRVESSLVVSAAFAREGLRGFSSVLFLAANKGAVSCECRSAETNRCGRGAPD